MLRFAPFFVAAIAFALPTIAQPPRPQDGWPRQLVVGAPQAPPPASIAPPRAKSPERRPPAPNRQPLAQFDQIMNEMLREHHLVGASLAIAKDGRLVLARGYGWADVAARQPATADSLFCIASVTKPFTSVAILKLVQEGKLDLDARLVDLLEDLPPLRGRRIVDPRVRQITVRHLLHHAGGWNRAEDSDGPHNPLQVARRAGVRGRVDAGVRWRIALGEPLDFAPGSESRYSNFGFLTLRLVIERASGEPYAKFVRQQVLAPMGITRMRLEPNAPAYAPGEVKRYGPGGRRELPGGRDREMGDSGGNWLATTADMVRFLTAVDGSRPGKYSPDGVDRRMRSQNSDVSRYFESREQLCCELGEREECHDGILPQAVTTLCKR